MNHPLENYRIIADIKFIQELEKRLYTVYYLNLQNTPPLEVSIDKKKKGLHVTFMGDEPYNYFVTADDYLEIQYNKLEKEARLNIENKCQSFTSDKQQEGFIKRMLGELQRIQTLIKKHNLQKTQCKYQKKLDGEIQDFIEFLKDVFLPKAKQVNNSGKKLKWKGDGVILTALFNDLAMGNESRKVPQIIDASPKEIADFIYANFLDNEGKDFEYDTLIKKTKPFNQKKPSPKRNPRIDAGQYFDPQKA